MRRLLFAAVACAIAFPAVIPGNAVARARWAGEANCLTEPPPAVAGAAALRRKYSGQQITLYGGGVSCNRDLDAIAAQEFTRETGIKVNYIVGAPIGPSEYSLYMQLFSKKSQHQDVIAMDTTWPGAFAPYLLDLRPWLGQDAKMQDVNSIENDIVNGRLVALPAEAEPGMMYYRKDLLAKYRQPVPKTWTELGRVAEIIQEGERKTNPAFFGYVFQGAPYEGLTCDALEWIASANGGDIIDANRVTVNNPRAIRMLDLVRSWVGTIAPKDVTQYNEDRALTTFNNGNAAFMRNWPYAWNIMISDKVRNKFGVAPLPTLNGGQPSGTLGGRQLGVSKYSQHKGAAVALVRYLTGPAAQRWRAVTAQIVPSIPSVEREPDVERTMPFLKSAVRFERSVSRPARYLGTRYNAASQVFWTGIYRILKGTPAHQVLPSVARRLKGFLR